MAGNCIESHKSSSDRRLSIAVEPSLTIVYIIKTITVNKINIVHMILKHISFFLQEILNGIVDKGPEFSELEYMNAFQLLNRSKAGKELGSVSVHLERLSDILGEVGVTV